MMKILVYESDLRVHMEYLEYLEQEGHHLIKKESEEYDPTKIEAIIVYKTQVTKSVLDHYPQLKRVMRVGVGLDKIDLEECKKRKITVLNTPAANADSVADLALWWTLSLKRRAIRWYELLQSNTEQERFPYEGDELQSCSIGFVWFGNIGKKIYQRLQGFGCTQFRAYDPYLTKSPAENVTLEKHIENILQKSDIVYVVVPLTEQTADIINHSFLQNCKQTVTIINTSRGWVCQENDLYSFLQQNPQASYYGDVWKGELAITDSIHRLLSLENCIITPHIGAHTKQAQQKMHRFDLNQIHQH